MMKLLLGRIFPAGAGLALLMSSASPIRPALNAFAHAANALAGATNEDTSDSAMPTEAEMGAAVGEATTGFSLTRMIKSLFGPSESDRAKAQLAKIIADVKGRSTNVEASKQTPAKPKAKGTKAVASKTGTKGSGKATAPKSPAAPPIPSDAPAVPSEGEAAAEGEPAGVPE